VPCMPAARAELDRNPAGHVVRQTRVPPRAGAAARLTAGIGEILVQGQLGIKIAAGRLFPVVVGILLALLKHGATFAGRKVRNCAGQR
jgi:hypothetical protein